MPELNDIERGQLCQSAIESLYAASGGLKYFPALLKRVIATRAWERRECHGQVIELANLCELITASPLRGWGEDPAVIEAVIRDDPEALLAFREAMKGKPGRPKGTEEPGSNSTGIGSVRGTTRAYSLDRVNRECDPETVAAVMAGELSANAALVRAGLRENRQVYMPRDPAAAAEKLRRQFGYEFAAAVAEAIASRVYP